jgi:hypothetical protein
MREFDQVTQWLREYARTADAATNADRWFAYLKAIETVMQQLHDAYPTPGDDALRRVANGAAATTKPPEIAIADLLEDLDRDGV